MPASSLIPISPTPSFFFFPPFFSKMSLSSFCLLIKIPAEGRECCLAPLCTNPTSSHSVGSNLRCCAGGTEITTLQRSRSFWVDVSLLWGSSNLFFFGRGLPVFYFLSGNSQSEILEIGCEIQRTHRLKSCLGNLCFNFSRYAFQSWNMCFYVLTNICKHRDGFECREEILIVRYSTILISDISGIISDITSGSCSGADYNFWCLYHWYSNEAIIKAYLIRKKKKR